MTHSAGTNLAARVNHEQEAIGEGQQAGRSQAQVQQVRGISADERTRLRGLINNAESAPEVSLSNAAAVALAEATYVNGLTALRAWFEEWAGIARVAVKRRDHLIRLGLARRPSTSNSESSAALSGQASQ